MSKKINVYVGDGHDLFTPGKRSPAYEDGSFMKENEHNRSVAKNLVRYLDLDPRFHVVYVSPEDTFKSLKDRVAMANDHYVKQGGCYHEALYLSIHANAYGSGWNKATGTETLYNKGSVLGERYAACIQQHLVSCFDSVDRGIKARDDLYVLKNTLMPAVLTEALFMTNKEDMVKLLDHDYRMNEAYALYVGICESFALPPLFVERDVEQEEALTNERLIKVLEARGYVCIPFDQGERDVLMKVLSGLLKPKGIVV